MAFGRALNVGRDGAMVFHYRQNEPGRKDLGLGIWDWGFEIGDLRLGI
jgi:hypothetical protein